MKRIISISGLVWILGLGNGSAPETATGQEHVTGATKPADNSYCYVCHLNYKDDDLAQNHAVKGIGCETCHGESADHSSDEDGWTAPDKMYAQEDVRDYCLGCHHAEDEAMFDAHEFVIPEEQKNTAVCTDCHGSHRLENRTRRWDKKTGKLISYEGGPYMDTKPKDKD